jgi:RNA polymerase sigma-70 factor (ECF subfamily)
MWTSENSHERGAKRYVLASSGPSITGRVTPGRRVRLFLHAPLRRVPCTPDHVGPVAPPVEFPPPTLSSVETDLELLGRLREGDEEAFVMLVTRYQQPMLRLARSMVASTAIAEEAVQDAWMGVVRGIDRFEGRSSLKTWLFRILANRARSAGAHEPSHTPIEALYAVDPSRFDPNGQWADPLERWPDESDNRLDAAALSPFLKAALDDLPPRQRQVVMLRDIEGLTNEEVCTVLAISSGNQRILLHRGRSRLRGVVETAMGQG